MKMNKTKAIFVAAIIIVAGASAGIIIYHYSQSSQVDVRLGYLEGDLHQLAFYVARENGYYEDADLTVEAIPFANGGEVMVQFESAQRSIDMAYLGFAPALYHRFNNPAADITVLAPVNVNGSALIVKNDDTIQNASDLTGLTIAVPARHNMQDFILSMILDLANLTHDDLGDIRIQSPSEMVLNLDAGTIDGYVAWEPHNVKGIPTGKYLYNSSDVWPNHPCCVVAGHNNFIATHNETVSLILSIHQQATEWIWAHPEEAKEIAMEKMNLSEEEAYWAMQNIGYVYSPNIPQMVDFVDKLISLNPDVSFDSENIPAGLNSSSFIDWFTDFSYF